MDWLCHFDSMLGDTSLADAALEYAAHGWPIFPCIGKQPAIAGGGGFKSASCNVLQVAEWWDEYPNANIGWALPVGWFAVDVDTKTNGPASLLELQRKHEPLPFTLRAITGSGGEHWVFSLSEGQNVKQGVSVAPGIDTRLGGRGYLLVSPSIHPDTGKHYRWHTVSDPLPLPAWLAEIVKAEIPVAAENYTPPPSFTKEADKRRRLAMRGMEALAKVVADAGKGQRNAILFWAWCRAAEYQDVLSRDEARAYLAPAAHQCGLTEREILGTMR